MSQTDYHALYNSGKRSGMSTAGDKANKIPGVSDADLDDNHSGDAHDLPLTITPNNPRPATAHAAEWVLDPGID